MFYRVRGQSITRLVSPLACFPLHVSVMGDMLISSDKCLVWRLLLLLILSTQEMLRPFDVCKLAFARTISVVFGCDCAESQQLHAEILQLLSALVKVELGLSDVGGGVNPEPVCRTCWNRTQSDSPLLKSDPVGAFILKGCMKPS